MWSANYVAAIHFTLRTPAHLLSHTCYQQVQLSRSVMLIRNLSSSSFDRTPDPANTKTEMSITLKTSQGASMARAGTFSRSGPRAVSYPR